MKVADLCHLVRAKNAGPFRVTIDCFCKDAASYTQLEALLDNQSVANAIGVKADTISRFALPDLQVIKFGLPRPVVQGSLGDRDLHGAQWAHVVAALPVPVPVAQQTAIAPPKPIAPQTAMRTIATVALVVRDYDESIAWYTQKLGFTLLEDTAVDGKRWVTLAAGSAGTRLLLAVASNTQQAARIGDQTGGRVAFFLETDDFARDHRLFVNNGVHFLEPPRHEPYGTVAVFEDLYANRWDLLQPAA
jgi:catechol 2,3-dioxygenase-like lactoylglutathione lyase family enzyme